MIIIIIIIIIMIYYTIIIMTYGRPGEGESPGDEEEHDGGELRLHPVSVRRFPSFRTQPLENLSHYL